MKEERRQFNVQDFISNEETPVETRDGRRVEIMTIDDDDCSNLAPVNGQIEGKRYELGEWESWGSWGETGLREDDLFFKNMKLESISLDIAKLLKDVPKGTKLYSPIFGECEFDEVRDDKIEIIYSAGIHKRLWATFYKDGTYSDLGECLLFPSKDNRDWSTFKIEKKKESIKVGDYLRQKGTGDLYKVTDIDEVGNKLCYLKKLIYNGTTEDRQLTGYYEEEIWKYFEKATKFDPNSLKPFDCVLVRDKCKWYISHFQEISEGVYRVENGMLFDVCIPYNEDTKHLLGTEKEEPEFYKL